MSKAIIEVQAIRIGVGGMYTIPNEVFAIPDFAEECRGFRKHS